MGVLVIDDEAAMRISIMRILQGRHQVEEAASVEEARRKLSTEVFDLILCDIKMSGSSGDTGLDLARDICSTRPDTAVVMVTGLDDPTIAEQAVQMGVYGYLVKPFTPNELRITVVLALRRLAVERSRAQLEEEARAWRLQAERERIGADLYTAVIDQLYRIGFSLTGALSLAMGPEAAERVRLAVADLDQTIARARSAITGLTPRIDSGETHTEGQFSQQSGGDRADIPLC